MSNVVRIFPAFPTRCKMHLAQYLGASSLNFQHLLTTIESSRFSRAYKILNTLCRPTDNEKSLRFQLVHQIANNLYRGFEQISISQSQCEQESQSNQLAGDETHSECTYLGFHLKRGSRALETFCLFPPNIN
jgi:hypothetical protein